MFIYGNKLLVEGKLFDFCKVDFDSGAEYTGLQYIIHVLFCFELHNLCRHSQLYTLVFLLYFTVNIAERWTAPLSFNSTNKTASPSCTLVIPPFQMTMTYWVFGPEVVANLTLGLHYFLKHVPTLKWLVCAKNAAEQGDSSLCEGRDGQRGVE